MKIRAIIAILNRMRGDGIVSRYAIGGAVAATFHLEPIATLDVDVFVPVTPQPGRQIATLTPIYEYLKARGATMEGEYIVFADWLVQFLPASGALMEEALEQALEIDVDGEAATIMSAEHLTAIALQTGRAKDKARVVQFVESGILDLARLESIICRHGLTARWQTYQRQFREDE